MLESGSQPASSRMVGPRSNHWTRSSIRRPPANRLGDQTMHGTRVIASYMVHFWMWPWSPRQSPWSEVKITTQSSA